MTKHHCLLDIVLFVQTGDKLDGFYLVTDMVKLVLSSIRDSEEADTFFCMTKTSPSSFNGCSCTILSVFNIHFVPVEGVCGG